MSLAALGSSSASLDAPAPGRNAKAARRREEIQVHTLPNGLTLALIPDHRVPLVHLQAAVRAGLPSETAATNGLNQLLASTLPKGTAFTCALKTKVISATSGLVGCQVQRKRTEGGQQDIDHTYAADDW